MQLRLLGPIEAHHGGTTLRLGPPKQRAVLAMLALRAGHTVSVDDLAEGLWGEEPPASAPKMLQHYVSHLRRALAEDGAVIATHGRGYALVLAEDRVDAVRFERLVEAGRPEEALGLWRDAPLSDLRDEPFAAGEIRRLEELHARALESANDTDLQAGCHDEVLARIDALVVAHPLRERLHAQRMLALYRARRQADALAAFRSARETIVGQIGVEPGPELRRLHAAILAQDPALELPGGASPGPRGPPRAGPRRATPIVLLAGAVLAAALVTFGISRVAGGDRPVRIGEDAVALLDPGSGEIHRRLPVGRGPSAIAIGAGSAWVASKLDKSVTRVARDDDAVVTIPVGGSPEALAFGGGSLWVADGDARRVLQIDPGTNRVVQEIPVGNSPRALTVADGALWVASGQEGTVDRIDLRRGFVSGTVNLGSDPTALAAGAGAVWAASEEAGTVTPIDPRADVALPAITVGNGPSALAVGEGGVWVVNRSDGTVARIDPDTRAVDGVVRVGSDPTAIAAGDGQIWVAGGAEGVLVRIAPGRQLQVRERIRTGGSPAALAAAGDGMWAAAAAPPSAHRGGTLRVELPGEAPDAVPLDVLAENAYLWTSFNVVGLVYDGLVAYRRTGGAAGGTLVGALATTAPLPSRDGRTYRFTLRPGVRYSDGRPVRPGDFRASMERFLRVTRDTLPAMYAAIDGAPQCVAKPRRCDLSRGIETDDHAGTITIHLTRPDGEFLHKLTIIFADVVPSGTPVRRVRRGERLPPGTGPYRVVSWDPDRGGVLVRNPYFHSWAPDARPPGLVDRIVIRVRPDDRNGSAVADVLAGRSDVAVVADAFASHVSPSRLRTLRTTAPGLLHSFPGGSTNWMFLNVNRPPFDDLAVRQALNLATDRARLVQLGGGPELATPTCQYVPAGFPGYEPYCPYTAAPERGSGWSAPDLPRAQRMIARSGAMGARVRLWVPDFQREQGRYFARLLRQLGFRPRLRVTPYASYDVTSSPLRDRPEMGFFGWGLDYLSAATFIEPTFTCASVAGVPTTNVGGFCDREVDGVVARALRAPPGDEAPAWANADRHLVDRAPAVPMTNRRALILAGRRVGNVDFHMVWSTLLDRLWVR